MSKLADQAGQAGQLSSTKAALLSKILNVPAYWRAGILVCCGAVSGHVHVHVTGGFPGLSISPLQSVFISSARFITPFMQGDHPNLVSYTLSTRVM